ncbi:lisH domain-containing protein FOPNL [Ctenocephalides felis]|uniref:lisH domain-containing protein FOPNL n=1 Tax=Ctenocephalides felis TaxID=7515 RepID=UPI000E6E2F85|nr:lisH domain-containing protein FOPNL [Ctenocephalides felis]
MATEEQLLEAIKQSLENEGHMPKLRAEIRSKIIMMLSAEPNTQNTPSMSDEVLLINELIREYFNWMGYEYTTMTLTAEAKMNDTPPSHSSLIKWLGIDYDTKKKSNNNDIPEAVLKDLPLLFVLLITALKNNKLGK